MLRTTYGVKKFGSRSNVSVLLATIVGDGDLKELVLLNSTDKIDGLHTNICYFYHNIINGH